MNGERSSSGGKGSAKPKPCVKCEGKGYMNVQAPVNFIILVFALEVTDGV